MKINKPKLLRNLILLGVFMFLFYLGHEVYNYLFLSEKMCSLAGGVLHYSFDINDFECVKEYIFVEDYYFQDFSDFIFKPYK